MSGKKLSFCALDPECQETRPDPICGPKTLVDIANAKMEEIMRKIDVSKEPYSECGGRLERKHIAQEFEREGIKVKLSGIAALVCTDCGEIYFQPGGADKVAAAANSLFNLAVVEKQHKRSLTAQICQG